MAQKPFTSPPGRSRAVLCLVFAAMLALGTLAGGRAHHAVPPSASLSASEAATRSLLQDTSIVSSLLGGDPRADRIASDLGTFLGGRPVPTIGQRFAEVVGHLAPRPTRNARAAEPADDISRILRAGGFAYHDAVARAAARHAVDRRLVLAIIATESGGNAAAVSQAGAIGLMQLMPSTAHALGVDPRNPVENIEGAVRYLAELMAMFGSLDLSLVAYNAGPAFALRYRGGEVPLDAETRAFLTHVRQLIGVRNSE